MNLGQKLVGLRRASQNHGIVVVSQAAQAPVSAQTLGTNRASRLDDPQCRPAQPKAVGAFRHLYVGQGKGKPAGSALAGARSNRGLIHGAQSPRPHAFTTPVGFVRLHQAAEHKLSLASGHGARDLVSQRPGRLGSDRQLPGQLRGRQRLLGGGWQIDGQKPLLPVLDNLKVGGLLAKDTTLVAKRLEYSYELFSTLGERKSELVAVIVKNLSSLITLRRLVLRRDVRLPIRVQGYHIDRGPVTGLAAPPCPVCCLGLQSLTATLLLRQTDGLLTVSAPGLNVFGIQATPPTTLDHLFGIHRSGFDHGRELVSGSPAGRPASPSIGEAKSLLTGFLSPLADGRHRNTFLFGSLNACLLYTSDAADDLL